MKRDLYKSVTDSIITLLESDLAPWRKPWADTKAIDSGLPFNATSGRHYNGINTCLLWADAQKHGYCSNGWLTYKQARDLGGHVRRGEHGQTVIFWKFRDVEDRETGETKTVPFARAYTVFNVAQCEGISETKAGTVPEPVEPDSVIQWAGSVGALIQHGGNRACYSRQFDVIRLPRPEQFSNVSNYHATALHELTHSTGHESRLARKFGKRFGDDAYAVEELVAEIGSAFLCASIGIANEPLENHTSYLAHWLKILRQDNRAIFTAAREAQRACDYCLEHGQKAELAA